MASGAKRQCLDGEGAEEALRQAQEQVARLQRQIDESARQVAAPPPPPASNPHQAPTPTLALPQPPAEAPPLSQPQSTIASATPQPAYHYHTSTQPHTSAADQRSTPYRSQPSFDSGFRSGRSRQRRTDTRGRLFFVYVCRNHSRIYCQICGEYLASPDFFDRNPDIEY